MQANLSFLQAEEATALNCSKAWASLRQFESFYPNMILDTKLDEQYSNSRAQCLVLAKEAAEALGLNEGIALDAILLLDRLMHHGREAFSEVHKLHSCICLFLLCIKEVPFWLGTDLDIMHSDPDSCLACTSLLLPRYLGGIWSAQAFMHAQNNFVPSLPYLQHPFIMIGVPLCQWDGKWMLYRLSTYTWTINFHSHTCILRDIAHVALLIAAVPVMQCTLADAGCYSSACRLMLGAGYTPWSRPASASLRPASLGRLCECTNRSVLLRLVAVVNCACGLQ